MTLLRSCRADRCAAFRESVDRRLVRAVVDPVRGHRVGSEAIVLYRREGYVAIPRDNDTPQAQLWFEKRVDVS